GILVFGLIGSAGCAEPALVVSLVNGAVAFWRLRFRSAAPQFTDAFIVKRLSGPHEDIVAAVFSIKSKLGSHLLEVADDIIGLFFGRASSTLSSALDVDAVLVGSG